MRISDSHALNQSIPIIKFMKEAKKKETDHQPKSKVCTLHTLHLSLLTQSPISPCKGLVSLGPHKLLSWKLTLSKTQLRLQSFLNEVVAETACNAQLPPELNSQFLNLHCCISSETAAPESHLNDLKMKMKKSQMMMKRTLSSLSNVVWWPVRMIFCEYQHHLQWSCLCWSSSCRKQTSGICLSEFVQMDFSWPPSHIYLNPQTLKPFLHLHS